MVCVYQDTHTQRDASIFFMEGVSQVTPSVPAALVANLCFNSELSAKICFRRQVGTGMRRLQIKEHTACLAANLCFQNGKTMGEVTEEMVDSALDKSASRGNEKTLSSGGVDDAMEELCKRDLRTTHL
jgi:hypothetical protein